MYTHIKRLIDIILSIVLILVLSPLFLIISIIVKIDSPGPIFYKQIRTGQSMKDFTLVKFRSMVADNDVYDFNTGDKITRVGKFIRKTSLDELPQLFNILRGDMSFVGPRPWLPILNDYYIDYQKRRFYVKPGITGMAQVYGRKDLNIIKRIDLDIKYVDSISIILDLKIILRTIKVVLNSSDNTRNNYTIEDELEDLKLHYISTVSNMNLGSISDKRN